MFIGRKRELARLNDFYDDDDRQVLVVYGRQGMGKTALLKEFVGDRSNVYFSAYPTTDVHELSLLSQAIARAEGKKPTLASKKVGSVSELFDRITALATAGKVVFVIDHYPNFVKADDSFEKELYRYMTGEWATLPLKLILCGDSFLNMQKKVLDKKAIWSAYKPDTMEIEGMGFYEAREFFADHEPREQAYLYGITGGIPGMLVKAKGSVREVTARLFLEEEAQASLLPERTSQIDLREMSYYNRILTSLAAGLSRVNQISEDVKKPKDVVVPYMNTLMSIGVVTKESPVTERTNRKKTRYSIVNTSDLFWYHFIAPHMELYYDNERDMLMDEVIKPHIAPYMEQVFIRMCKEYLVEESARGKLPFSINDIGNWWENDDEKKTSEGFDLVAVGETEGDDAMVFARCYYENEPIGIATLKELIELTKHVRDKSNAFYLIFSKSGFQENTKTVAATIKNIMLISLSELCS